MSLSARVRRVQEAAQKPPLKREVARRKPRRRVSRLLFAETPSHRLSAATAPFDKGGLDGRPQSLPLWGRCPSAHTGAEGALRHRGPFSRLRRQLPHRGSQEAGGHRPPLRQRAGSSRPTWFAPLAWGDVLFAPRAGEDTGPYGEDGSLLHRRSRRLRRPEAFPFRGRCRAQRGG